jgi:hypothetical protein
MTTSSAPVRKGRGILSWFLNLTTGKDSSRGKGPLSDPRKSIPVLTSPVQDRAVTCPEAPRIDADAAPAPGHSGIYEIFRNRVLEIGCTLRGVEEEMSLLGRSYRACMPPARLQLYPWAYPKGSRPRALYWVRLARRQVEVCDRSLQIRALKRPRWCKRLKIRCKTDLRNAIHWNGLDAERETVLRFYALACSLNKAHRSLAQRPPHVVQTFQRASGGIRDLRGFPSMPLEDPAYDHLNRAGNRLLECAWRMQWIVEKDLAHLNLISTRAGIPSVRLRTTRAGEGGASLGFVWEDSQTGLAFPVLRQHVGPLSGCTTPLLRERTSLMESLDSRMEVVHAAMTRLSEIAASGQREFTLFRSEVTSVSDDGVSLYQDRLRLR